MHGRLFYCRYHDALCILQASQQLVYELFTKLNEATEPALDILVASIKCVLKAASFLGTLSNDKTEGGATDEIQSVFIFVHEALKQWIVQQEVVGGSMFGSSVNINNWKGVKELMVGYDWQCTIALMLYIT